MRVRRTTIQSKDKTMAAKKPIATITNFVYNENAHINKKYITQYIYFERGPVFPSLDKIKRKKRGSVQFSTLKKSSRILLISSTCWLTTSLVVYII